MLVNERRKSPDFTINNLKLTVAMFEDDDEVIVVPSIVDEALVAADDVLVIEALKALSFLLGSLEVHLDSDNFGDELLPVGDAFEEVHCALGPLAEHVAPFVLGALAVHDDLLFH